MKWATVIHTALSKQHDYIYLQNVSGQSPLSGSKAAVDALALPITGSLISVFLIFPEILRIWKSYRSFVTMTILPYSWRMRPFYPEPFLAHVMGC